MALAKPTFRADYANGRQLSPLETFARASSASRLTKLGALVQAAAWQPRFDYDPATLASKGLLLEPAATNNATQSEFPNGLSDTASNSGLVTASTMAGFAGALAFGHNGSTSSWAYKVFSFVAGQVYAIAVVVEMTDGLAPVFGSATAQAAQNDFGLVIAGQAVVPGRIEYLGGIRYRVIATTAAIPTNTSYGLVKYSSNSSRTFKVTGYDLRVGAVVDSYIPTAGAAATRQPDSLSVVGADFARIWRPDEGTLVMRGTWGKFTVNSQVLLSINDLSNNNRVVIYRLGTGVIIGSTIGGVVQFSHTPHGPQVDDSPFSLAISFINNGELRSSLNGSQVLVRNASPIPQNLTTMNIGHNLNGIQPAGWLAGVEVYPRAASLAELAEVTR